MTIMQVTIAQHERALVWKDKSFVGVLGPGKRWIVQPFAVVEVERYDLTVPEFEHARLDFLLKEARDVVERHFQVVELTESEAALVYKREAGRCADTGQAPALLERTD